MLKASRLERKRWGEKAASLAPTKASSTSLYISASVLALAIFVADTVTDLEIAVAVFYVAIVLISIKLFRRHGVLAVSAGCMALTIISYVLTQTGSAQSGLINLAISLTAIAATTYLALKIVTTEDAEHQARAQLAYMARVTALGELTASIAHEVNQPLAAAVTSAQAASHWLDAEPSNIEKALQAIERTVKNANRASEVVTRIRGLAKGSEPKKELFDINSSIREVLALTRRELEESDIVLDKRMEDDLPAVLGDEVQAQQVILNLILNAIEAVNAAQTGPKEIAIRTERHETSAILVSIGDTGPGFSTRSFDAPFEAFYTTKSNGIGIGLTISRTIIEAHGGRIWAKPNSPHGALVQFTLPLGT